ncbi:MAG: transketolase family protein [Clostridia bacterium]|nr:transketolase family protein [Clostridia bacterium]
MSELHNKEMRQVYVDNLLKYSKLDRRIVVLEADLMNCIGTGKFKDAYPRRFINCGIAESNMIGVAAGLASCGKLPFCSSFTPFATRRCYDQIAVSVGYTKQNVKIVGTDPGIMAQINGGTHMSFEDVALMTQVPDMIVVEPCDCVCLDKLFPQILKCDKPMYIRLQRKKTPPIYDDKAKIDLFKANTVMDGDDITIIACGIMIHRAIAASMTLKNQGISARVIALHTYKPLDTQTILKACRETGAVVVCENHHLIGGLGSEVASLLMQNDVLIPMTRVGIGDRYGEVGKEAYLAEVMHLTEQDIVEKAQEAYKRKLANI